MGCKAAEATNARWIRCTRRELGRFFFLFLLDVPLALPLGLEGVLALPDGAATVDWGVAADNETPSTRLLISKNAWTRTNLREFTLKVVYLLKLLPRSDRSSSARLRISSWLK